MKRPSLSLLFPAICAIILLSSLSTTAVAKTKGEAQAYALTEPSVPVVIYNDSGILFLGSDANVFRTYHWKQVKPSDQRQPFFVVDMDGDNKPEILGVGKPTFMLDSEANPRWVDPKGCDQVLIADFTSNESLDVACLRGSTIQMNTHDHQMVWELNLGKRIEGCLFDDINGDRKADLECKFAGKKEYAQVSGDDGSVITLQSPESTIEASPYTPPLPPFAQSEKDLSFTRDLNNDGKEEEVTLSKKSLVIKSGDQETKLSADAKKYKRHPVATLSDSYISNFKDEAQAKAALDALSEPLSKCYTSAIKKNPFAGSGRIILQATVGSDNKVSNLRKIHSSVADKKVLECTEKLIKGASFGEVADGATGNVNVTILYSFVSR